MTGAYIQINTLYVGNLPAISPPALPPNFLEESLRSMFETCPGYKRMSFRQKVNGPMCFVEFEDIHFAANCIQNLYGHTLVSFPSAIFCDIGLADQSVWPGERRYPTFLLQKLVGSKRSESLWTRWTWFRWSHAQHGNDSRL